MLETVTPQQSINISALAIHVVLFDQYQHASIYGSRVRSAAWKHMHLVIDRRQWRQKCIISTHSTTPQLTDVISTWSEYVQLVSMLPISYSEHLLLMK